MHLMLFCIGFANLVIRFGFLSQRAIPKGGPAVQNGWLEAPFIGSPRRACMHMFAIVGKGCVSQTL